MDWFYSRRRKDIDIKKFLNNKKGIEVMLIDFKHDLYEVVYHGPEDSLYKDGVWRIRVHIPFNYPDKPPLLFFMDEIFHPNIPESVSKFLDVPSEAWRETYDIEYMFEQFLPQLLRHPNPERPINHKAAELLKHNKEKLDRTVRRYCLSLGKRADVTASEGGIESSQHRNP
ncbi:hypothetical protein K1719_020129 [Acacia pycnantha]|nr:hypothetical protein K1719_020129 [Acacia pycnantha]